MHINDFKIERYFAQYEFSARYLLSSSDCDGYAIKYVLDLASDDDLQVWENQTLGYTETKGSPMLRSAIAKHYQTLAMDNLLVLSPGEGNFCLMNVLLEKGDEVICMAPMYQSLYQIAESIGCKVNFWQPDYDNNNWYYNPERLKALVNNKTKLIIVNFPHNPTGYIPSASDWDEIINIARANNLYLFSDEMYHLLGANPAYKQIPACELYENAISLWGMSKSFGLAGLRIGWLASKNKAILAKVEAFKDYLSICNSCPSEILATIALNNHSQFITPNNEKIRLNIKYYEDFAQRNEDLLEFSIPRGGSTAFIKLKTSKTAMEYAEDLVKKTGIMLLPSETFDYGTHFARIGFGRRNLPEILSVWEAYHRSV